MTTTTRSENIYPIVKNTDTDEVLVKDKTVGPFAELHNFEKQFERNCNIFRQSSYPDHANTNLNYNIEWDTYGCCT